MLGFKSLEDKLRAGDARTARATVLDCKSGIGWSTGQRGDISGDQTKFSYTLRVQPDGEPPFEAAASIRRNRLDTMPDVGGTVTVLYDPADHSRIAFDVEATNRQALDEFTDRSTREVRDDEARYGSEDGGGDDIAKLKDLAALHASGALTDAEFATEKAKLLGE